MSTERTRYVTDVTDAGCRGHAVGQLTRPRVLRVHPYAGAVEAAVLIDLESREPPADVDFAVILAEVDAGIALGLGDHRLSCLASFRVLEVHGRGLRSDVNPHRRVAVGH